MNQIVVRCGGTFTRLTVVAESVVRAPKGGNIQFWCECECGEWTVVTGSALRTGNTRSCGCLGREVARRRMSRLTRTHGMTESREYDSYRSAKQRCGNPSAHAFCNYGGRGIHFKFASFEEFYAELGPRPIGTTLDRIDNDGDYRPGNVRWATGKQQASNRRPPHRRLQVAA